MAAAVVGGLVVWPASPAAADPVTYEDVLCENVFSTATFDAELTWTMSAEGPSAPVAPGETFTLSDLVVREHTSVQNDEGELTVLGGQVIHLGFSENNTPDQTQDWFVGDVELTAPTEFGVHWITPEATWNRSPGSTTHQGFFCPRDGEEFPDEPFAFVEVADVDPTPTTTTTTTTVPVNGNGDDPDGDDPDGDADPEAEARAQAEAEAELEAEAEALEAEAEAVEAAEAALLVGASPRFAG